MVTAASDQCKNKLDTQTRKVILARMIVLLSLYANSSSFKIRRILLVTCYIPRSRALFISQRVGDLISPSSYPQSLPLSVNKTGRKAYSVDPNSPPFTQKAEAIQVLNILFGHYPRAHISVESARGIVSSWASCQLIVSREKEWCLLKPSWLRCETRMERLISNE
jgi:hypothetical protein